MRQTAVTMVITLLGSILWGCVGGPTQAVRSGAVSGEASSVHGKQSWHLDIGFRTVHAKLESTERSLDRRLDLPLKLDFLGAFSHPRTPIDRRTDLRDQSLYIGLGRREWDWLSWTVYVGGGTASDKEHQRFLNANLDVAFRYTKAYLGLAVELYPWGVPIGEADLSWKERLERSRPYGLTGLEIGYVSSKGRGHFSLAPLRLYEDEARTRDWIFSYKLGLGWHIPINDRWSLNLAGDYSFHLYRPEEYNSWNVNTGLRYRF